jgi:protoporphyrinogen oxidase
MKKNNGAICIIGAGPSGLGCAYELQKLGCKDRIILFDKNDRVGGLARSTPYKHHYFDIGPHRFYTKNAEVLRFWKNILKRDFVEVKRLTRILYKNKLFLYPVRLMDVVEKLGMLESLKCLISFLWVKISLRNLVPKTFEEWITKHFGKKLYSIFFKTYTEKVWGIPCGKIGAEWASQRIKNLNFYEVVKNAIFGERVRKAKSLIDTFYYPKKGAGYFYEKLAGLIKKNKGSIFLNREITSIHWSANRIKSVENIAIKYLFSSMPITSFIHALNPKPPRSVLLAAKKLYFRDHITVNLIVDRTNLFPDNWIYVHSPEVQMARVTNYNNFIKHQTSNVKLQTAISVEYFVFKDDKLWTMKDEELIELAKKELEKVGLVKEKDIMGGFVVKESESYPTYYLGHKKYFDILKNYVSRFENLQLIGRGGMYKYNNMDHAIYSGMLAARNFVTGKKTYDVWQINEDAEYLESK